MRSAKVYYKNEQAGVLTQMDNGEFVFRYHQSWIKDRDKPSISLTLPKSSVEFRSSVLFPFFFNMIPEGSNKLFICKRKRIDVDDYFGILLEVAHGDTIGAVRVVKYEVI